MMIKNVALILVDKDGNEVKPNKDGSINLLLSYKFIVRTTYYRHIRQIVVHWFTHSSFEKVCRNLKYKKAYEFFFTSLYCNTHYSFNHEQSPHKYRYRW